MEYTQWDFMLTLDDNKILCLNPCCNGIYSMRQQTNNRLWKNLSLNPCCNGIYSMSRKV